MADSMKSTHHSFDTSLAKKYGLTEAILIHHFQHWIKINQRLKKHLHDNRTWTYQTLEYIAAHFEYLSRDQVNRLLRKLVRMKILIKGNFNHTSYDRTIWYAFNDEEAFLGDTDTKDFTSQNETQVTKPHHMAKSPNGYGEIATPIPDTKDISLENISPSGDIQKKSEPSSSTPPKKKKKKEALSENREGVQELAPNVHLTPREQELLSERLHHDKKLIDAAIEKLDSHKEATGQTYCNDYAAMRKWVFDAIEKDNFSKKPLATNKRSCYNRRKENVEPDVWVTPSSKVEVPPLSFPNGIEDVEKWLND